MKGRERGKKFKEKAENESRTHPCWKIWFMICWCLTGWISHTETGLPAGTRPFWTQPQLQSPATGVPLVSASPLPPPRLSPSHSLFHCFNRKPPHTRHHYLATAAAFSSLTAHPSPSSPFFVWKNKHQIAFFLGKAFTTANFTSAKHWCWALKADSGQPWVADVPPLLSENTPTPQLCCTLKPHLASARPLSS